MSFKFFEQLKKIFSDVPAWLPLILAGRPWPACEDTAKAMSPIVRRESPSWGFVRRPIPL
ncbi:MAG: hypothetical protein U9P07_10615 [Pseudomonadota bacterium]|nr:hypothetical protein [Pseudomonadota bacterium]